MTRSHCFSLRTAQRLVLSWLLVAGVASVVEVRADQATDDYKLAIGLYNRERWENAAAAFNRFITVHPDHPRVAVARLYYGSVLVRLDRYAEARGQYRTFVRRYPRNENLAIAMFRSGECSYFLGEYKDAEQELFDFLQRFRGDEMEHWALSYFGTCHLELGNNVLAREAFQRLIKRHSSSPAIPDARFGLARALEALGESARALDAYSKIAADRTNPNAPNALSRIGDIRFQDRRYADSAATYDRIPETFPNSSLVTTAQLNAGIAWYRCGKYTKAIDRLSKVSGQPGFKSRAGLLIGRSHMQLGDFASATTVLDGLSEELQDDPLAQEILFRRADCERLQANLDTAAQRYLAVIDRWPQGRFADESLYFASEADLASDRLERAERSLDQLQGKFAQSTLRHRASMLRGRLFAARGGPQDLEDAVVALRKAVDQDEDSFASNSGRYYLSRTLQRLERHDEALQAAAPLAQRVERGEMAEFVEVLVLAAGSSLHLRRFEDAVRFSSAYISQQTVKGKRARDALVTRAVANAELGKRAETDADLTAIGRLDTESEALADARMQVAEIAWAAGRHNWSAQLFERLTRSDTEHRVRGFSGLGWSYRELGRYAASATVFGELVEKFPEHELAPEAAYLRGDAFRQAGDSAEAARAFSETFDRYAPKTPPAAGTERKGQPHFFAYESGRSGAMMLETLNKPDKADAAWQRLIDRFPNAKSLDELLDHWAWLNLENGRDARSDEIFGRLIRECPDSPRADNARLSLGESALITGRLADAESTFSELESSPQADADVQEAALYHLVGIASETKDWKRTEARARQLLERYPDSRFGPRVRLHLAESRFTLGDCDKTVAILTPLRELLTKNAVDDDWADRVWVVLADAQLQLRNYEASRATVAELRRLRPGSPYLYQANEIFGRGYKTQASPQFDKARRILQQVVEDPHGRRTVTAAKAQFLIADTYLLQLEHARARDAFLRVYIQYKFPDWQAPALFQVARCEEALMKWKAAARSYQDLIREYPDTEWAGRAKKRLTEVRGRSS